jgi:hypothetical protein
VVGVPLLRFCIKEVFVTDEAQTDLVSTQDVGINKYGFMF